MPKGLVGGGTILAVVLAGFIFASLGMIVTSVARGYDSFNYYFTLVIAPMFFFSGIFFPTERLGPWLVRLPQIFPPTHLAAISRGILGGAPGGPFLLSLAAVALFAVAGYAAASALMQRRSMP